MSDYYSNFEEEHHEQENGEDYNEQSQYGTYNVMVRVLEPSGEKACAVHQHSIFDINLDSYCTRHMTPCYELEKQEPCVVDIMVGNKEKLKSTHKGILRLGNIVFTDVLYVPGLLQTLISQPQLELKGCKIVSEGGVRTISRNGQYLFHATLERNSYVFRPAPRSTNSRVYTSEEIAYTGCTICWNRSRYVALTSWSFKFPRHVQAEDSSCEYSFRGEALLLRDMCVVQNAGSTFSKSRA